MTCFIGLFTQCICFASGIKEFIAFSPAYIAGREVKRAERHEKLYNEGRMLRHEDGSTIIYTHSCQP